MSRQELFDHRERIYSEVLAVLSAYYQPDDSEETRTINKAWWCDVLQDWRQDQVVYALRKWNTDNPDRRPTPGHIVAILKRTRGQAEARRRQQDDAPRDERTEPRATPEQKAAILAEKGFTGLPFRRMPKGEE